MTTVPPRRRRTGAGLLAAGLAVAAAAGAVALRPAPARAADFGSFDLRAGARGYQVFYDAPDGARTGEFDVPESQSQLQKGPVGYALASIGWPGPLAGNAGSLVQVLQPGCTVSQGTPIPGVCPLGEEANALNYPVRAEARTGDDPPETTNDSVPGTSLRAKATAEAVESESRIEQQAGAPFGPSRAFTTVKNGAEAGTAEAASTVQDFELAGVLKIESVVSSANATTDGTSSEGWSTTAVSGMSIAGQPAYVDGNGVKIGEEGEPANAIETQIANQALEQAGISIAVSEPVHESSGATTNVVASSLIITWEREFGTIGWVLGGANVSVTAAPAFDFDLGGDDLGGVDLGGGVELGGTGGSTDFGDVATPTVDLDTGAPPAVEPPTSGGGQEVALPTSAVSSTGKPVSPVAVVLGLLAAGLVALGAKRLTDDVLAERAAVATCPLEAQR